MTEQFQTEALDAYDINGNILNVGDFVQIPASNFPSQRFRILELQDPWALNQWAVLVQSVTNKNTRYTFEAPMLTKLSSEESMILMLEYYA